MNKEYKTFMPADKSNFMSMLRNEVILKQLNKTPAWRLKKRNFLIKRLFAEVDGNPFQMQAPFHCTNGKHIYIGKNFFSNYNCTILDRADVHIGDNVLLAPNVLITTIEHPMDAEERKVKKFDNSFEPEKRGFIEHIMPVTIGNNVWISTGSVVCPGVTIGDNSVIGAGSIVTKDIPPNVFACGVPCEVIKNINE